MEKDFLLSVLNNNGINNSFIDVASKMNVDIKNMIYEKLIKSYSKENFDVMVSTLMGIYGNYISKYYFEKIGFEVINEVPVYSDNKLQTSCDLIVKKDNNVYYGETKTSPYLLYKSNYNHYDKNYKYECMGLKLINQIEKLKKVSDNVFVVIFDGCIINQELLDKLKELNVKIIKISLNVFELEKNIKDELNNIIEDYKSIKKIK